MGDYKVERYNGLFTKIFQILGIGAENIIIVVGDHQVAELVPDGRNIVLEGLVI